MQNWSMLQQIVNEADESGWTRDALTTALNKLAVTDMKGLVESLCRTKELEAQSEASDTLGSIFVLAKAAVAADPSHQFLEDLCEVATDLGCAELFVPEALSFLQSTIERLAKTRHAAVPRQRAVEALLKGITAGNPGLQAFLTTLAILMPVLKPRDRDRFIDAARQLPQQLLKDPLVSSLERYHDRVTRAEDALHSRDWTAPAYSSVITIHSHKGGVGKTTIAIALAMKLAQEDRRVCLVDCDEQGPSLHYYLPVEPTKQKDALFFSDWFCSDKASLPEGLVQPVQALGDGIACIAGSFIGVDITALDEVQTEKRSKGQEFVRNRLTHLLHVLLKEKGFDSVILDTSPGLVHLSLDIFMACLNVNGSRVFVMRPRPVDVAQFCLEEDWIVRMPDRGPGDAIVVNFLPDDESSGSIDVSDSEAIANHLTNWPQFQAYSKRLFTEDITHALAELVKETWPKFVRVPAKETGSLRHAGTICLQHDASLADAVKQNDDIMEAAQKVLKELAAQWKARGEKV